MKRVVRLLVATVVVAILLFATTFTVREGEVAIVLRFGSPSREVGPGLHFKLPTPFDTLLRVDRRIHVLDPDSAEFLTHDKKNIVVDAFLAWRVADPHRFAVRIMSKGAAETRLTDVLRSVLNDVISSRDFAALISATPGEVTMKEVSDEVTARTRERALADFGIDVKLARIKRLNFPGQNKNAVYDRMMADRKTLARGYRSEGEEEYQKIQARTDRQAADLTSAAERQAAEIRGSAEAEAFRVYAEAEEKDPELWNLLRRLELFETSYDENSTIVLPADHELLEPFSRPPVGAPKKPGE